MAARQTPVMRQHAEAKKTHPDAVLFFRLGDFYEMFGDDAVLCSRVLDLTLTSRNRGKPDEIPMAGIPHHAAHGYIGRLLAAGHKVAVCEQMADPSTVKGIVPRKVVRVLTPGTVTHQDHLESGKNSWLAAVELHGDNVGVALYDLSTGELSAGCMDNLSAALGELSRANPREILIGHVANGSDFQESKLAVELALPQALVSEDEPIDRSALADDLQSLLNAATDLAAPALQAAARALRFARGCNPTALLRPTRIARWDPSDTLFIDATAETHLELSRSQSGDKRLTLLATIDFTRTAQGSRRLRRDLLAPLKDVALIRRRLDEVELFVVHSALRDSLRKQLDEVTDLERLAVRAELGEANPRDLGRLRDGLLAAAKSVEVLQAVTDPALKEVLGVHEPVDTVSDLAKKLDQALVDSPPAQTKEGAIFRDEYDTELTQLRALCTNGTQLTVDLESTLRSELSIPTLKVRYTRVFGWYIEVSRSHLSRVPEHFHRKQTIANGERYSLEKLDEIAERLRGAEEQYRAKELAELKSLLEAVRAQALRLADLASRISRWDVASALAELAHARDYVRPEIDDNEVLDIVDGRHPVVEHWAAAGRFVPNDVSLDINTERLWLITGPNMAGKSTLLRQTALIVILGQMGSYVPAKSARIGLVDRVMSRVGASDNLARGESTFMVEMRETAEILLAASRRSLIILDEVGRGTSTFDGLAIAWAVAEHLANSVQCRVLFATHYHEMTAMADANAHVANYSVSAKEQDGNVVFLHRLVRGAASQSYGIAVAKLAGLPENVLSRAQQLLTEFESAPGTDKPKKKAKRGATGANPNQLDLFGTAALGVLPNHLQVLSELGQLNLDELRPIEALSVLAKLQGQLGSVTSAQPACSPKI